MKIKNKSRAVLYFLMILIFIIVSVILLIWNAKTKGLGESFLPLLMLVITAVTCSILTIINIKEK